MSSLTEVLEQQSVVLVEATIPADMAIDEWRRRRMQRLRPARRRRLAGRLWHAQGGAR
jgi:hypothetical protein